MHLENSEGASVIGEGGTRGEGARNEVEEAAGSQVWDFMLSMT